MEIGDQRVGNTRSDTYFCLGEVGYAYYLSIAKSHECQLKVFTRVFSSVLCWAKTLQTGCKWRAQCWVDALPLGWAMSKTNVYVIGKWIINVLYFIIWPSLLIAINCVGEPYTLVHTLLNLLELDTQLCFKAKRRANTEVVFCSHFEECPPKTKQNKKHGCKSLLNSHDYWQHIS